MPPYNLTEVLKSNRYHDSSALAGNAESRIHRLKLCVVHRGPQPNGIAR